MERLIVEYMANALWQIPLLVAGVGGLLWALGSDLQTRHRAWLAVLAVAVLMPFNGMDMGHGTKGIASLLPGLSMHSSATYSIMPAADIAPAADDPLVISDPSPAEKSGLTIGPLASRWLVRLYLGALLFAGWRILRAWIAAQALLRRSRSIHLAPRAMAIFAQVAQAQNIVLPRLRQSDETVSPVVIGVRHPVLLLPTGFDQLKDDEILAALSHEFAHLARRDYLVNLICQIAAVPIAWHPATYLVQKRIRDTREMLCDAVAADEMASPVRYATCLVAFAFRALDDHQGALATQGLSMFDNRILEERILQLTQEPQRPRPPTRLARLAGASVGLVMSATLALLFHITPTLADAADATETPAPVHLTLPIDLPALPAAVAPSAPAAPVAPSNSVHQHRHAASEEIQRGIAEEKRQQAEAQREAADARRDAAREIADAQREAAHEAAQAAREAGEEARRHADEIKRQVAEAIKANEAARTLDMEAIRKQVAAVTANVDGPEFKAQMAELQAHMQQLHDTMAELRDHMKEINREMEKSLNSTM